MATRARTVSTHIEDGVAHIKCYSDPTEGDQHVTDELVYDVRDIPSDSTIHNLAALALTVVASNRFQRVKGHPDVPAIYRETFAEMHSGNWKPGKRELSYHEPSDLIKAVAEATNTPVHLVEYEFENGCVARSQSEKPVRRDDPDVYRDRAGKPRKFFSKEMQASLKTDSAIAPIIARIEQERAKAALAAAKGNKAPSKLGNLFASVAPSDAPQDRAAE